MTNTARDVEELFESNAAFYLPFANLASQTKLTSGQVSVCVCGQPSCNVNSSYKLSFCYVQDKEKKKKESIFDLSKYIDKPIRVKFQGGREGGWINPDINVTLILMSFIQPVETIHVIKSLSFILWISLSASGVLKGFDPLLNLVLDGTIEYMRGKSSEY